MEITRDRKSVYEFPFNSEVEVRKGGTGFENAKICTSSNVTVYLSI